MDSLELATFCRTGRQEIEGRTFAVEWNGSVWEVATTGTALVAIKRDAPFVPIGEGYGPSGGSISKVIAIAASGSSRHTIDRNALSDFVRRYGPHFIHHAAGPCAKCDGKGTMKCSECNGDGTIECGECGHERDCEECIDGTWACEWCEGEKTLPERWELAEGPPTPIILGENFVDPTLIGHTLAFLRGDRIEMREGGAFDPIFFDDGDRIALVSPLRECDGGSPVPRFDSGPDGSAAHP
jgi:hypothetical protein